LLLLYIVLGFSRKEILAVGVLDMFFLERPIEKAIVISSFGNRQSGYWRVLVLIRLYIGFRL